MNYGKNLTGERKATFSSVDVTGQLNLDNGSFVSSGHIVSSGSMSASHGIFNELFSDRLYCNQATFNFVEFDGHWAYRAEIVNLSMKNACFTTLNDVNQKTFAYIGSLSSDAQSQIDNISLVTQDLKTRINSVSTVANTALGSANAVSSLINSVSLVAYTAYNNELALS